MSSNVTATEPVEIDGRTWLPTRKAAEVLGVTEEALRKRAQRFFALPAPRGAFRFTTGGHTVRGQRIARDWFWVVE